MEGDISPELRELIERHFLKCDGCFAVYDGLRKVVRLVNNAKFSNYPIRFQLMSLSQDCDQRTGIRVVLHQQATIDDLPRLDLASLGREIQDARMRDPRIDLRSGVFLNGSSSQTHGFVWGLSVPSDWRLPGGVHFHRVAVGRLARR